MLSDAPVTVLLPTHDHATTLGTSLRSVQEQTFSDFCLVVIGDGVGDDTRDVLADVVRCDSRVVFLDRPKTPRHAEPVRHEVLQQVDSWAAAYVGDDDLLLPDHLETMLGVLEGHDFAHPLPVIVTADRGIVHLPTDLSRQDCLAWHLAAERRNAVSLTGVVHTVESYRRLPHGWRAAPPGHATDHYMWLQYFALEGLRAVTGERATTIKLDTASRQGFDPVARGVEISDWWDRMHVPGFAEWWDETVAEAVRRSAVDAVVGAGHLQDALAGMTSQWGLARYERDVAGQERDVARHERDVARNESGALLAEVARLQDSERELERLRAEHERLRDELERLRDELERARSDVDTLTGSASWRLTAPLRRIRSSW